MYPVITHIEDLVPHIRDNPQFRIDTQPNGMTIVCYMLRDEDTFTSENEDHAKECRGITFYPDGRIAARPLHKFHNVGESESTHPDAIPWHRIVRVMNKRDGSMITPVLMPNGAIICKTKKSFSSPEAIAATQFIHAKSERLAWVETCLKIGVTPIFEWTSPRFPVVIPYEKDELTLLHLRDNETGDYDMEFWGSHPRCPFPLIENLEFEDPRVLLELAKTTEDTEGWIIQADCGEMWKIKTKWYLGLHHSVTFTRWRDIARSVVNEQSDDLKAAFAVLGRSIEPIVKVEADILHMIDQAQHAVAKAVEQGKAEGLDAKAMAALHKGRPFFGQIMRVFRDQDADWNEWYRKNYVDSWSLEVIPTNWSEKM